MSDKEAQTISAYDVQGPTKSGRVIRTRVLALSPRNTRRVAAKLIGCEPDDVVIIKVTSNVSELRRDG